MRSTRRLRLAVGAAAVAMLATACGGGDDNTGSEGGGTNNEGATGGTLVAYASEPTSLMPSAADDSQSIDIIRQLYRGLTKYHPETGEVEMDVAESIESEDNVTWTIKVKEGYTFTNGEPVNADAFIRAWNFTGNVNNAQNNSYFMSKIAGFEEMQAEGAPADAAFSGLKKVDEYTFTVELSEPFSGWPAVVGYSGYFPMAEECVTAPDVCTETPIGNGPYMLEGEWQRNEQLTLVKNPDYAGEDEGNADTITFRIFDDINTGFAAFEAGELDIMYGVPPEELPTVRTEYSDTLFQTPSNSFTYVGFPLYQPQYQNADLRKAFSMAIDRQAIIDALFDGAYSAATGWVSPNFEGTREGVCDACEYNPEEAKRLFDAAGGFDGTVQLWANGGAGHEDWLQAVGDSLKKHLGVEYKLNTQITDFGEYLTKGDNHDFSGPYRLSWGPDYPVAETYLGPLYSKGGSSNTSGYDNPEFDAAVAAGNAASDSETALAEYQRAEDMLAEDMPSIPLWFGLSTVVWDDTVENLDAPAWNTINNVDYGQIPINPEA